MPQNIPSKRSGPGCFGKDGMQSNLQSGVLFFGGARKKSNERLGGQSARHSRVAILSRSSEKIMPDRRLDAKWK